MIDYFDILNTAYGNDPQAAVAIAVEVYKDAGKYVKDVQAKAKDILTEIITETGQTEWSTDAGKVYFPRPSVSVSYDARALDALCASSPELAAILQPHRRETERAGSMTIR